MPGRKVASIAGLSKAVARTAAFAVRVSSEGESWRFSKSSPGVGGDSHAVDGHAATVSLFLGAHAGICLGPSLSGPASRIVPPTSAIPHSPCQPDRPQEPGLAHAVQCLCFSRLPG
jgi:hypothetical protein